MDSSRKLSWSQWLPRLIGFVLLIVVVTNVDMSVLFLLISSTRWHLVVAAGVSLSVCYAMKAVRLHYILDEVEIHVSLSRLTMAYCAGVLIGTMTPGRIGELSKVVFVRCWRKDCSWGTAFGTVVLDRISDVTALVLLSSFGTIWLLLPDELHLSSGLVALLVLAMSIVAFVFPWKGSNTSIVRIVGEKLGGALQNKLGDFGEDFWVALKLGTSRSAWLIAVWTSLSNLAFFIFFIFLGRAVGSEISSAVLCWALAIAALGAILPISIGGIGVRDFILVQVFNAWDETSARALAVSILYLGVINIVAAAIGIWPFITGDIDFKAIRKRKME